MPKPKEKVEIEVKPVSVKNTDELFVYVEKKVLKNTGNYENVTVTIGMRVPYVITHGIVKQLENTIEVVSELIDTKLVEELERL